VVKYYKYLKWSWRVPQMGVPHSEINLEGNFNQLSISGMPIALCIRVSWDCPSCKFEIFEDFHRIWIVFYIMLEACLILSMDLYSCLPFKFIGLKINGSRLFYLEFGLVLIMVLNLLTKSCYFLLSENYLEDLIVVMVMTLCFDKYVYLNHNN